MNVQESIELLQPEIELEDARISSGLISSVDLTSMNIKQCAFDSIKMLGCQADRIYCSHSEFRGCDLSNTSFSQGKLTEVKFIGCKLMGTSFNESILEDVTFTDCVMDLSQFSGIKAKELSFLDCRLVQAYFDGAKMPKTNLRQCDLGKADFSQAWIVKSDVRGSNLEGMRVLPTQLDGVIVSPEQALYWSRLMGLQIEF